MIAPSLLSADFSQLKDEIRRVEKAGADLLHVDVMDGHFVPNITLGPFIVTTIHKCTRLPLDCHLMIEDPNSYVDAFVRAGAQMISVHAETRGVLSTLRKIKRLGVKAGIALNPNTSFKKCKPFIPYIDYVLVMSVYPGFAEQKFIESTIPKIKAIDSFRSSKKLSFKIEVDGGINLKNVHEISKAGADIIVSGSAIFKSKNYFKSISHMKARIHG